LFTDEFVYIDAYNFFGAKKPILVMSVYMQPKMIGTRVFG